jgi:hypothetical protein
MSNSSLFDDDDDDDFALVGKLGTYNYGFSKESKEEIITELYEKYKKNKKKYKKRMYNIFNHIYSSDDNELSVFIYTILGIKPSYHRIRYLKEREKEKRNDKEEIRIYIFDYIHNTTGKSANLRC